MIRYLSLILIFVTAHLAFVDDSAAHDDEYKMIAPVLDSAENFFISLRDGEFAAAWDLLSESSHRAIINDVYNVTRKINGEIDREEIIRDFSSRGRMFTNYWNSFHRSFDFDMILNNSEWEMGLIRKDEAEIIITYNNSGGATLLKMRREQDMWKVGLAESFWQRKALNVLHLIFQ